MTQYSDYVKSESRGARMRFAAALMATVTLTLAMTVRGGAQTVVPIPFASNLAGIAPGGTVTQCSSANDIPTFSGGTVVGVHYGDGCLPNQAALSQPYSTVVDALGNVYIGDYNHYALRVIYNGGANLAAAITASYNPYLTVVPQKGLIYTIAGGSRQATITKTLPSGSTSGSTAYYCNGAGTGPIALGSEGSGCPGSEIEAKVRTVALDTDGNVFFTSTSGGGQSVHVFCVVCGRGSKLGTLLGLELPSLLPVPPATTPWPFLTGYVYELVGQSTNAWAGDSGVARSASMYSVRDVAVDQYENVYASDGANAATSNNNIRVIYSGIGPLPGLINIANPVAGDIYTLAGGGGCTPSTAGCPGGYSGDNGPATSATFNSPYALFVDANQNVYVGDYNNARVRAIYQGGTLLGISNPHVGYVYTVAGGGATTNVSGTPALNIAFGVVAIAGMDVSGNLYVYDTTNKNVWKIDAKTDIGVIIAGRTGTAPGANAFCAGTTGPKSTDTNGDGCPGPQTVLGASGQITFDPQGNFYETEAGTTTSVVRKFSYNTQFPATPVNTPVTQPLAFMNVGAAATYTGESFGVEGGTTTEFADAGNNTCALNASNAANTVCVFNVQFSPRQAGLREGAMLLSGASALSYLSGVGRAANVSIDQGTQTTIGTGLQPNGVAADEQGNLYIADKSSGTVKKVAAAGGTPVTLISGLQNPAQIAVDGKGNVYVADTGNNRIAMTSPAGGAITALGTGLTAPVGVAVDALGNVYATSTGANTLVKIAAGGGQTAIALTGAVTPIPTRLALDAAGDLFVVDSANKAILELATNAQQVTLTLTNGTSGVTPMGVAVDAAGDLYVTDTQTPQLLEFLAGNTAGTQLVGGLTTPVDVAIDANGSLYVADSSAVGAIAFNRVLDSVNFKKGNIGAPKSTALTVTDTGNQPLLFNGAQFATVTDATGQFSITAGATGPCALNTAVAAGTNCQLSAVYSPTIVGPTSGSAVLLTNAANSAGAAFTGTGAVLITTTTSATISPSSIFYGQQVTVNATITGITGTTTGVVEFSLDGQPPTSQAYAAHLTQTYGSQAVGSHAVTVTYQGDDDNNYATSQMTVPFTVQQATTTTALNVAATASGASPTTTFTATINSTTASGMTGTVNFYSGSTSGTPLNPSPLAVSNGVVTYSTTTVSFTSNTFTAVYSGDANFAGSTSTATTPGTDFNLTEAIPQIKIPQGGNTTATIVLTPYFGYSGTITPVCSGLPQYAICRYQPTSAVVSGGTPVIFTVTIYTSTNLTSQNREGVAGSRLAFAMISPVGLAALFFVRRRKAMGRMTLVALVLMLSLVGMAGLSGCTNPVPVAPGGITPAGVQTVTVTFTDGATHASHAITFGFEVVANQ